MNQQPSGGYSLMGMPEGYSYGLLFRPPNQEKWKCISGLDHEGKLRSAIGNLRLGEPGAEVYVILYDPTQYSARTHTVRATLVQVVFGDGTFSQTLPGETYVGWELDQSR